MKPMLAKPYDGRDVTGWSMSEKLDGVRAIWTGSELLSRNAKPLHAPEWFLEALPHGVALDGELHTGRGAFQEVVSFVRKKKPVDDEWNQVLYSVFDLPHSQSPWTDRYNTLRAMEPDFHGAAWHVLDHEHVFDRDHMQAKYEELVAKGAEGLMIKCPQRPYVQGRSDALLKYKPVYSEEAVVVGYQAGKRKHLGRVGALVCMSRSGATFELGTGLSDAQREAPPAVGAHVTYEHGGLTDGGVPRFPRFVAVRDYE